MSRNRQRAPRWLELDHGESIIAIDRAHPKALAAPVIAGVILIVAGFYLGGLVTTHGPTVMDNRELATTIGWVVPLVCIILTAALVVVTVGTWSTETYTVTNRRIVRRWGIITRRRRSVDTSRITETTVERTLLDRIVGSGSIDIAVAGGPGLQLRSIPQAQEIQRQIAAHSRRSFYHY